MTGSRSYRADIDYAYCLFARQFQHNATKAGRAAVPLTLRVWKFTRERGQHGEWTRKSTTHLEMNGGYHGPH